MAFIYHRVPDNPRGHILYPLNSLKNIYPDIYENEIKKYYGREQVMKNRIAILNCAWNDAIHLSPLHPKVIALALSELDREIHFECYEIDAGALDPKKTVVYLHSPRRKGDKIIESDFIQFNPLKMEQFTHLPQGTKDYYKEIILQGERPLLYHLVPHILYRGSLDISNAKIIKV